MWKAHLEVYLVSIFEKNVLYVFILFSSVAFDMFYNLQDYIAVKEKYATYLPHTAGRYAAKRFRKAQVNDRK